MSAQRLRWFELCLVLLLTIAPYFLSSLFYLIAGHNTQGDSPNFKWTTMIVREFSGLLLLGYVLSRRMLRMTDLGLRWSFRDVGSGFLVASASYLAYGVGHIFVRAIHHAVFPSASSGPTPLQIFGHTSFMAIPFVLLNPFFEELIVRAYLMTEVKDLTGSWFLSVVLSVVVQTSYHLYYGWEMALSLSFQFLIFAIYYARKQRAMPIIVAHGVFDIIGLMQLW
ncbi:MAG: CPBP family intramembrane glutamic endopeptidase [Terracidiphilus sp.]